MRRGGRGCESSGGAPGTDHDAAAALPHPETQPAPLRFFDCNVTIGPRPSKPSRARWSTEHLLADMDLAEISGALVSHAVAHSYDPCYGNARLAGELAKASERLFGLWCLLPLASPDFYVAGDDLLRAMAAAGIRAVR